MYVAHLFKFTAMIEVGSGELGLEDFRKLLSKATQVSLHENVRTRVEASQKFLADFSNDKIIYGINTGFGPMAQYAIDADKQTALQYNLIRSHCSGTGDTIPEADVRAMMLARLNTLSLGGSGVAYELLELIADLINKRISPVIYSHGGVGASGDLVQLAHLALCLIGEGQVWYQGEIEEAQDVFEQNNIKPFEIKGREGLALMNGTSAMSGIGMLNIIHARKLIDLSLAASCMLNEIVESFDDHFSQELNGAKRHRGQQSVAANMRMHLADSQRIKSRKEFYSRGANGDAIKEKVQEFYSLRCVPQILGPILEAIDNAQSILEQEVNSVNDNPVIDWEGENVFHGGNFHGDYVSFEMDKLRLGITKLSMLADRQLNYVLNDKLNERLPPFVNRGELGFNFGMQGVQFTSTSTTAENQTLSNPMYVHSIQSNNDNQDIVSMGTNAALLTQRVVNNTFEVMAIELTALAEAIDCLSIKDQLSSASQGLYNMVRETIEGGAEDRVLSGKLRGLASSLKSQDQ